MKTTKVLAKGMPVIVAGDEACTPNVAIVLHIGGGVSVGYLESQKTICKTIGYFDVTPLAEFGVGLICSTKLKMFSCCPLAGIPARDCTQKWNSSKRAEILKYNPDIFALIPANWLEKSGAITMRAMQVLQSIN